MWLGKTLKRISAKESLSLYERKQHKPRFDDECPQFLDQRKQVRCSGYRTQIKVIEIM
jgi:hypothetical protein